MARNTEAGEEAALGEKVFCIAGSPRKVRKAAQQDAVRHGSISL